MLMKSHRFSPPQFLLLKRVVASCLCNGITGSLVRRLYSKQLPAQGCSILVGDSSQVSNRTCSTIRFGLYESAERRFIKRYLCPDLPVIELGAGIGVVSSVIGQKLNHGVELISLEANPRLADLLAKNVQRNAPHVAHSIVQAVVDYGNEDGRSGFVIDPNHLCSSVLADNHNTDGAIVDVECATLSSLRNARSLNKYQLVCDIEGGEAGILEREAETLRHCQLMIIELHDCTYRDQSLSAEAMSRQLVADHDFELLDKYGNVYVYARN